MNCIPNETNLKNNTNILNRILVCLTFFYFANWVYAQNAVSDTDFSRALKKIDQEILVDFKQAKKQIEKLETEIDKQADIDKLITLQVRKMDLYESCGDIPRLKYELNKTKKILRFQNDTLINHYWILYFESTLSKINGNFDKMHQILKKIPFYEIKKDPKLMVYVKCQLARYYKNEQKTVKLNTCILQAERISRYNQSEELYYHVQVVKGHLLFDANNTKTSKAIFLQAKKITQKNKWQYAENFINTCIADIYFEEQNLDSVKYYYDLILKDKKKVELRDVFYVYSGLEYYFNLIHQKDSAYHYSSLMNTIDDQLENEKSEDLVKELEKDFQFENTRFLLSEEKRKNSNLISLIITIFIIVISSSVIGYLFYREKVKSNKMLTFQKEEIDKKNKQINHSLKEKENLLKEIHHRVKNNLQIVSSLLNLQSRNITDEAALNVIEESKDRIYAIALIHNQLYTNLDFAYVEMKNYIPKLLDQIKNTIKNSSKNIEVSYRINQVNLSIDEAVPIGLIFCELISNSYKHGFPEHSKGEIKIEFEKTEDQKFRLTYQDNGKGMEEGMEFLTQESTGAEIVGALIEQIDATYEYIYPEGGGFGIKITF